MALSDTYLSIAAPADGLYKDKGSKFIGYAYPVKTEEEVKKQIAVLKKEHFGARHWCYAYFLGADKKLFRANDDGEPSGTAGKPILGQLQSRDLTDVGLIVVRYFGGTLLGTSGLINAYREAAADALNNAKIIELIVTEIHRVEFSYEQMNNAMKVVKELGLKIKEQSSDTLCSLTLEIRKTLVAEALFRMEKLGQHI